MSSALSRSLICPVMPRAAQLSCCLSGAARAVFMTLEGNPTSFPIPLFSAGGNPHILCHVFRDISVAQCGGLGL